MLKIRLTRVGKKNSPAYRVVVADKKRAVKGKFIEILGNYNPILKPKQIVINKERALFWMKNGAQPSDTVRNLMCDLEILNKKDKVNKIFGKKLTKKQIKEGVSEKTEENIAEITEENVEIKDSEKIENNTESVSEEVKDEASEQTSENIS